MRCVIFFGRNAFGWKFRQVVQPCTLVRAVHSTSAVAVKYQQRGKHKKNAICCLYNTCMSTMSVCKHVVMLTFEEFSAYCNNLH